ncbi:MAG: hypothetical protein KDD66_11535 [Bdellovibrionales bacterium]|nr:hypothetical protein [Bdellovibrionales bacterium]
MAKGKTGEGRAAKSGSGSQSVVDFKDEAEYERHVGEEIREASEALGQDGRDREIGQSWKFASKIIQEFKPVPWVIWRIVRGVYGRVGRLNSIGAGAYISIDRLIYRALKDPTLGGEYSNDSDHQDVPLDEAIDALGDDVSAAVCLVHAVSRRIQNSLADKVSAPLIEDAMLRAKIGFYLGAAAKNFGKGRGMLAGFSGRSGLTILIASGTTEKAQEALLLMARGVDIRNVGLKVYDCEPLQVSALALTAAGCNREAAFGTASYSNATTRAEISPESEAARWLAAFVITENIRMGTAELIEDEHWGVLGLSSAASREEVLKHSRLLQRRGHGWDWMARSQSEMSQE